MAEQTLIAFEHRGGRPQLRLQTGLLAPRIVRVEGGRAQVALVATTASLLGGDHCRLEVHVAAGLRLELIEVAATVCYDGRGSETRWTAMAHVAGSLLWNGEPFVVCQGAQVSRETTVDLTDSGRALLREQLVRGRVGEPAGALTCRTNVRLDGLPLLVEALHEAHLPRVLDSVLAVGWRPQGTTPSTFLLDGPGALHRSLGEQAHGSTVPGLAAAWSREFCSLS